jgi:hypothetical protein
MPRKPTDTIQLKLRFDERLRRRIEQAAARNDLSMNAEIVARLERSFDKEDVNEVIAKTVEVAGKTWIDFMAERIKRGEPYEVVSTSPRLEKVLNWAKRNPEHSEAIRFLKLHHEHVQWQLGALRQPRMDDEIDRLEQIIKQRKEEE